MPGPHDHLPALSGRPGTVLRRLREHRARLGRTRTDIGGGVGLARPPYPRATIVTPLPVPQPSATPWHRADRAACIPGAYVVAGLRPAVGVLAGVNTASSISSIMPTSPSGTAVVTALGEIDYRAAPALSSRLHQAIENYAGVVLDLTGTTLFDNAGLQILDCAADHARTLGVAFTVVCHEPSAVCSGVGTAVIIALRSSSPSARSVTTSTGTSWT